MKKFLGSLFMLLVAGGAAGPYVSGYYTKKYYYDAAKALSTSRGYQIEIESYDMGWLHSTAHLKLILPKNSQANVCSDSKEPVILRFEDAIQHGPILLGEGMKNIKPAFAKIQGKFMGFDENLTKTCANLAEFKWPSSPSEIYSYESEVSYKGDFHTKVMGAPFENKGKANIKWQGMKGEINLENKMTVLNYQFTFPSLTISESDQSGVIEIKDMKLDGQHQKMPDSNVWLGNMKFNVSSLHVQDDKVVVDLNGMTFAHVLKLDNNLLAGTANYVIDSAVFDKIKLGPINMMFSFNHIEPSFVEMLESVKQNEYSANGYMNALKQYQSKNKEEALSIINKQLKQSPEVKIDQIAVQSSKGQLLMNAMASVGGPEANLTSLENYMMIASMVKSSGEFAMDESVFDYMLEQQSQETANKLPKEFWAQQQTTQEKWVNDNVTKLKDQAIKTGAFVLEGKKILSRYKYENGGLKINGKSMEEIMGAYNELNKPKPVPVPTPAVTAPAPAAVSAVPPTPTTQQTPAPAAVAPAPVTVPPVSPNPQAQPTVNNPNDPAKPAEPMPVSSEGQQNTPTAEVVPTPSASPSSMPPVDAPTSTQAPAN